jgi:amino acid adenylation domain-containing protein
LKPCRELVSRLVGENSAEKASDAIANVILNVNSILADKATIKFKTNSDFQSVIGKLSQEKRAWLESWLQERNSIKQTIPRLLRTGVVDKFPTSYAQERLWFLDQLRGGSIAYNMPVALRVKGVFDVTIFEKVINEIISRHEVLRTTFELNGGEPVQVIHPVLKIGLQVENLGDLVPEQEIQRIVKAEAERPFDLMTGPLLRLKLMRIGVEEHLLCFTIHHIISDGWSMGVLVREFGQLYEAFARNNKSPLAELPMQYAEYAMWQRTWLQREVLSRQVRYWKEKLKGAPEMLKLPTKRPRSAAQSNNGAMESLVLSKETTMRLKDLGRDKNVTLFMTLLTAFKVLLHRHTGENDILVGTPIANRTSAESEKLIGFFVNTLVLRTRVSGELTFLEVLQRVSESALQAYEHQDIPFMQLVQELQPQRSLSHGPLFQIFFNMLNFDTSPMKLPGLTITIIDDEVRHSKFDIALYVREAGQELRFQLVYDRELFACDWIREILEQLKLLLHQLIKNPEKQIADFSLVTERLKERLPQLTAKIVQTWNGAVHCLFSEQACRTPNAVAIVDATESWTYAELEKRSNQLALHLLSRCIGNGSRVAICGYRNANLVLAIMGVLKAGASFFILDKSYPTHRLMECMRLAQPGGLLLLDASETLGLDFEDHLQMGREIVTVKLPRNRQVLAQILDENAAQPPKVEIDPEQEAYLMFTSGSTGKPKGVIGTHRPLAHFVEWQVKEFGLTRNDRFTLLSGLSHDPLMRDIFTPLSIGGRIYIPDETVLEAGELARWMRTTEISIVHLTPMMCQAICINAEHCHRLDPLKQLRYAFFGGDVLLQLDVDRLKSVAPFVQCVNFYGTTETPQAVGYYRILEGEKEFVGANRIPIGQGIEGVHLMVMGRPGQLAGVGELGEIWVRTPYLAKGYLRDEALTKERFQSYWFGEIGDRIYRTGDLGRYSADGHIEFVGRADRQTKVKGFRIELGEIEATIDQHPNVKKSLAVLQEDESGDRKLVAYITTVDGAASSTTEWRGFLKKHLPEFMIPVYFVELAVIPLTPNGKVDWKALPAPAMSKPGRDFVSPRTPMEMELAIIWEQVLKLERVGITDNFFELGGDSLSMIVVVNKIRTVIKCEARYSDFYSNATLAELANTLDNQIASRCFTERSTPLSSSDSSEERADFVNSANPGTQYNVNKPAKAVRLRNAQNIVPSSCKTYYKISPAQSYFIHFDCTPIQSSSFLSNIFAFDRAANILNVRQAIAYLIERHEILRTSIHTIDKECVQHVHEFGTVDFSHLAAQGDYANAIDAIAVQRERFRRSCALQRLPLLQIVTVDFANGTLIMFRASHVLLDARSMQILTREFIEVYGQFEQGRRPSLAQVQYQYRDYSESQHLARSSECFLIQKDFWLRLFRPPLPHMILPSDFDSPRRLYGPMSFVEFALSDESYLRFKTLQAEWNVPFSVLSIAAFARVLYNWCDHSPAVLMGGLYYGRYFPETENMVGNFLSLLMTRIDVNQNDTFRELIEKTQMAISLALDNSLFELKDLEEALGLSGEERLPLTDVHMNVVSFARTEPKPANISRRHTNLTRRCKCDLLAGIYEYKDGIVISFIYRRDLFKTTTIDLQINNLTKCFLSQVGDSVIYNRDWI